MSIWNENKTIACFLTEQFFINLKISPKPLFLIFIVMQLNERNYWNNASGILRCDQTLRDFRFVIVNPRVLSFVAVRSD